MRLAHANAVLKERHILKINTEMEIAQGYARQPKRIYAVEKCCFSIL